MSQALSNSTSKKKQDERNSKLLREIAALPSNRFCFECGQRGPTYVNITHGSFCCSTCSGLLRGLNPPHRVKSISMATFSIEEINKIRSLGNEENQKTWMGLFDGTPPKFSSRDEMQTYLTKKYEKKVWYVSRVELEQQEMLLSAARERASQRSTSVGSDASSQLTSDLFPSDPFGIEAHSLSSSGGQSSDPYDKMSIPISQQPFSPPAELAPALPFFSAAGPPAHSLPPKNPNTNTADPFSTPQSSINQLLCEAKNPFSDFDAQFGKLNIRNSMSTVGISNTEAPVASCVQRSTTMVNPGVIPPRPTAVSVINRNETVPEAPPTNGQQKSEGDKYSALAELDQLFHSGTDQPKHALITNSSDPWRSVQQQAAPHPFNPFYPNISSGMPSISSNPFETGNTVYANGSISQDPWSTSATHTTFIPKSNTIGSMGEFNTHTNAFLHGSTMQVNGAAIPRDVHSAFPFTSNEQGQQANLAPPPKNWNPFLN